MWELLTQLYKRFGLWALLGVALVFGTVWWIADHNAQPCEKVAVFFGFIEYNKACPQKIPIKDPSKPPKKSLDENQIHCQELRQHLEMRLGDDARLMSEVKALQAQVRQGNHDAQTELQNRMEAHSRLQQDILEIKAQLQAFRCLGQ